jgi:hypothetical protein
MRPGLDILFVALNPPTQSNTNGHYFSGSSSRFFKLLYASGLITENLDRSMGDDLVFGGTRFNYLQSQFGVVDLIEELVETNSGKVAPRREHVARLLDRIQENRPRFVCVIHSKVKIALNKHGGFLRPLEYGNRGKLLPNCPSEFVLNYFPNGNSIPDKPKLEIFEELRIRLGIGT